MALTNCEIDLILTWSVYWVFFAATGATTFAIKETKFIKRNSNFVNSRQWKAITTIKINS